MALLPPSFTFSAIINSADERHLGRDLGSRESERLPTRTGWGMCEIQKRLPRRAPSIINVSEQNKDTEASTETIQKGKIRLAKGQSKSND
jgi:hypothetical protein